MQRVIKPNASGLSFEEISTFAKELSESFNLRPGECLKPIVRQLNGSVKFDRDLKGPFSLMVYPNRFIITLEKNCGPVRERYYIAKCLGHWMIHYLRLGHHLQREIMFANRRVPRGAERDSNWFAAALLLPRDCFNKAFLEYDSDLKSIARHFNVHINQVIARASALSLLD